MNKKEFLDTLAGKDSQKLRALGRKFQKIRKEKDKAERTWYEARSEIEVILHKHFPGNRFNYCGWVVDTFEYRADQIENDDIHEIKK